MPGMFPEISVSGSSGSNPGATNWQQQLAADISLTAGTDTTIFTQAAPAAGTYSIGFALIGYYTSAGGGNIEYALEIGGSVVQTGAIQISVLTVDFPFVLNGVFTLNGAQAVTVHARSTAGTAAIKAASSSATYTGNFASTFSGFRIN